MKTRRGYQGNVLLVEMIVVLLFFSLSAVISMGVFVKARQMVDQAALLTAAAAVCAVIAYWDKLAELGDYAKTKVQQKACASEYEDYEE